MSFPGYNFGCFLMTNGVALDTIQDNQIIKTSLMQLEVVNVVLCVYSCNVSTLALVPTLVLTLILTLILVKTNFLTLVKNHWWNMTRGP